MDEGTADASFNQFSRFGPVSSYLQQTTSMTLGYDRVMTSGDPKAKVV
jgi:hypothetical protein